MAVLNPNLLLVEGEDDKRVLVHFMDQFVVWGDKSSEWVVDVKVAGSITELLESSFIDNEFTRANLKAVGIVVDANADLKKRWDDVCRKCLKYFPDLPTELPNTGIDHSNSDGLRLGIWLMPNNESPGILESFLATFAIDQSQGLWPFVNSYCLDGKAQHAAPYKDIHLDKALIHSWLALQNPPGQQLHSAFIQRILQPSSPLAEPFVKWFCELFQVQRRIDSVT